MVFVTLQKRGMSRCVEAATRSSLGFWQRPSRGGRFCLLFEVGNGNEWGLSRAKRGQKAATPASCYQSGVATSCPFCLQLEASCEQAAGCEHINPFAPNLKTSDFRAFPGSSHLWVSAPRIEAHEPTKAELPPGSRLHAAHGARGALGCQHSRDKRG